MVRTHESPDTCLLANYKKLGISEQTASCIAEMIQWADSKRQSAAIVVLAPREKEMEQIVAQWLSFSRRQRLPFLTIQRVDSSTAAHERKRIRQQLQQEIFKRGGQDTLVIGTDVFAKSINLWINGLVDTGLSMFQESNGFLTIGPSSKAEEIQRKGRGGRVTETLYKKLYLADMLAASELDYVMEKRVAKSLVVGRIRVHRVRLERFSDCHSRLR